MLLAAPFCIRRQVALVIAMTAFACADAQAIEMFTYFGDGSRVGLPSLEVPVEAYPGIPLRSDRIRARRRAMQSGPAATTPTNPKGPSQTITIRSMPEVMEAPPAAGRSPAVPRSPAAARGKPTPRSIPEAVPVAPEPEDVALPPQK